MGNGFNISIRAKDNAKGGMTIQCQVYPSCIQLHQIRWGLSLLIQAFMLYQPRWPHPQQLNLKFAPKFSHQMSQMPGFQRLNVYLQKLRYSDLRFTWNMIFQGQAFHKYKIQENKNFISLHLIIKDYACLEFSKWIIKLIACMYKWMNGWNQWKSEIIM